jgi:hypothetical protein
MPTDFRRFRHPAALAALAAAARLSNVGSFGYNATLGDAGLERVVVLAR